MKRIVKSAALMLLAMALLLCQTAFADAPAEAEPLTFEELFNRLIAEDSEYSRMKATYMEYYPEIEYTETLEDDGFTISVSETEYTPAGSWKFALEGDALKLALGENDFSGYSYASMVQSAVADYHGVNSTLLNGYMFALDAQGLENDFFTAETDEETGATVISIALNPAYDMAGLDEMVATEEILTDLGIEPLGDSYMSRSVHFGKITMLLNGSKTDGTLLVGEYGGLDDLAYQALINNLKLSQPEGWEEFTAAFTALEPGEFAGYEVIVDADEEAILQVTEQIFDGYKYAIINYGAQG